MPSIAGMRWSATSIATASPRVRISAEQLERLGARAGAEDPVALAEAAAAGRARRRPAPRARRRRRRSPGRRARRHAQLSIGDGGMRVLPVTCGITIASSSTKHHDHVSPGSSERISGCSSLAGVPARVFVRRVVTAADVPALEADPQVQPDTAFAQAVLASRNLGRQLRDGDRVEVRAAGGHRAQYDTPAATARCRDPSEPRLHFPSGMEVPTESTQGGGLSRRSRAQPQGPQGADAETKAPRSATALAALTEQTGC